MLLSQQHTGLLACPHHAAAGPSSLPRTGVAASLPSLRQHHHHHRVGRRSSVAVRAAEEEDPEAALEARLAKLRKAADRTPYNQGASSAAAAKPAKESALLSGGKPSYNFEGEQMYYQGPPHRGDLAVNLALGITLLWLPLTLAAVGCAAFVKYRFTDKRFSIQTTAPWKTDQVDVAYQEVKDIVSVGRGVGLWGDVVVTLRNDDKVEMRSLDRFLELKEYILKRRDELVPPEQRGGGVQKQMGAALSQAELMGEAAPAKKGFAK